MRFAAILAAALFLAVPAAAQQSVRDVFSWEGHDIPLPPGEWQVAEAGSGKSHAAVSYRTRALFSVTGGVIDRVVLVTRYDSRTRLGFLPWPWCDAPEAALAVTAANRRGRDQDCWIVGEVSTGLGGGAAERNAYLRDWARAKGLFLPVVTVGARYHLSDRGRALDVEYLWTPELLLPPPADGFWSPGDWSLAAVEADPAKLAVMTEIAKWAVDRAAGVKAAF